MDYNFGMIIDCDYNKNQNTMSIIPTLLALQTIYLIHKHDEEEEFSNHDNLDYDDDEDDF